jgi:hypothetical protein
VFGSKVDQKTDQTELVRGFPHSLQQLPDGIAIWRILLPSQSFSGHQPSYRSMLLDKLELKSVTKYPTKEHGGYNSEASIQS